MAITAQVALDRGLRIVDDAKYPSSKGAVSDQGMHIPDLDIVDGKNILPTQAGYVSFFGSDRNLDDTVLGSLKVQESFSFRTKHGDVVQVALTSNGLYLSSSAGSATATRTYTAGSPSIIEIDLPGGKGDWIRAIWAATGHASPWELWTYALIDNDLYLYHKGLKYIYRMYSVQPEQVVFDELEPTYVISTGTLYQFIIHSQDDSTGDDTWKAVEFNTTGPANYLGKFTHPTDKAHQVYNIEQTVLSPFYGAYNASLDITTRTKVDIDASIAIAPGYTEDNVKVYANGQPEELIVTYASYDLVGTGGFRGNQELRFECENITLGGTINFNYDGTLFSLVTSAAWSAYEFMEAVIDVLVANIPDGYAPFYYQINTDAVSGEISIQIAGASSLTDLETEIFPSCTYTGTATTILFHHPSTAAGYYEPYARMAIQGQLNAYTDHATFSAGEVAWIYLNGTIFSVTATAGESADSILAKLHAKVIANDEWILDGGLGYPFIQGSSEDYLTGGILSANFDCSDNIILYIGNDYNNTIYAQGTTMTFGGFKEYGLTKLGVEIDGTYYNIPVSSIYDSNDIVSLIASTLTSAGVTLGALDVTTPASAYVDYDLIVNIPILDGSTPTATLTQDGTTQWALDGGSPTSESVDLLQVDGIYQARGRLGYWLQDGTMGWSATNSLVDFTPSTVTRANQISVKALRGKIIKCVSYENGFIVYATGNVLWAQYIKDLDKIFSFSVIENAPGLIDPRHVTSSLGLHYYWHSLGLHVLDPQGGQVKEQLEEMSDWINTYKYPITLQVLSNRYLVINTTEPLLSFSNRAVRNGGQAIQGHVAPYVGSPVELPAAQQGLNLYPIYKRAYIFDTKLGKWGTVDSDYLVLSSMVPINQSGYQLDKDYQNSTQYLDNHQRGILILGDDGKMWIANDNPTDSYMVFGHFATHRTRRTKLISAIFEFVDYPDATMDFEPSLDHATIDWNRKISKDMKILRAATYPNMSAYWFNLTLRGRYHVKRGLVKGQEHGR